MEKELQSLKDKRIDMRVIECSNPTDGRRKALLHTNNKYFCEGVVGVMGLAPDYFFKEKDVQKHCLDKQRVRDAIKKGHKKAGTFDTPSHVMTEEQHGRAYALGELERELGL